MGAEGAGGGLFARNVPGLAERLGRAVVGVAGCGGLGSNAAVALVRAGVGRLILVDCDRVEESNLNRQHFFRTDIGRPKTAALADHLRAINPAVRLEPQERHLLPDEVAEVFGEAELLVEAFDLAEAKQWLIERWCRAFPERWLVCASGIAGYGGNDTIRCRRAGRIVVCGDEQSDMAMGLCAPRVALVANLQANAAIELLMAAEEEEG
jgi:sulfur carrier protein ThiS adenylyltransferase